MLLSLRRPLVAVSLPLVAAVLTAPVVAAPAVAAPASKKTTTSTTTITDAAKLKSPTATKPHGRRWN